MYSRLLKEPIKLNKSSFLFGPRGTGKITWLKGFKSDFPEARLYLFYGGTR
jgi:predicted AAA+ superfamily ATPase